MGICTVIRYILELQHTPFSLTRHHRVMKKVPSESNNIAMTVVLTPLLAFQNQTTPRLVVVVVQAVLLQLPLAPLLTPYP